MALASLAAVLAVLVPCSVLLAPPASAHAQLESSSPSADALLAVPPTEIVLRFTEPLDPAVVVVRLLSEQGSDVVAADAVIDPADPRVLRVGGAEIGFGITTVSWTTRSATDGHTLSGSFAFRVGGASRAPAAATVEGDRPAPWNVATRWLTILGFALAAGTAVVGASSGRRRLAVLGLAMGLLASLGEPILLWLAPPEGWEAPSLAEAFRAQPTAWLLRPAAAVAGIVAVLAPLAGRRGGTAPVRAWPAGLIGLLGLALTSHAAGRETLRLPALLSVILHEWTVALWVGGLLLLALDRGAGWTGDLRRFSGRALPLALVALVTGVVNAGFLYPSLDRLRDITDSDYGLVLIAKVAGVALVLALAALHRRRLGGVDWAGLRLSIPAEGVAAVVVLAGAATLAMLAPPSEARDDLPDRVELALPADGGVADDQLFVVLAVEPEEDERRRLVVSATDGAPLRTVPSAAGGVEVVEAPPVTDLQLARVTLSGVSTDIAPTTVELSPAGDGTFSADGFVFAVPGWWRADVTVRRPGLPDDTVAFYLLEPDPNLVGFDRVPDVQGDPEAAAIQARARALFDARTSYVYVEHLNSGDGGVESIRTGYSDNAAGSRLPAVSIETASVDIVRQDGRRFMRQGDGDWVETGDPPVLSPAEVAAEYDGAEQVRFAGEEEVDGRRCLRITFHVPESTIAAAWYTWWVDAETGELVQEAMVSRAHYMVKRYTSVNSPLSIEPPTP